MILNNDHRIYNKSTSSFLSLKEKGRNVFKYMYVCSIEILLQMFMMLCLNISLYIQNKEPDMTAVIMETTYILQCFEK